MGSSQIRGGGSAGRVLAFAALGLVVAFLHAIAARAELPVPPKSGPAFKGAAGSVIQYQEAAGGRILYLEQTGAILVPVAPAVPGSRRDDLPPVASAASAPAGGAVAKPPRRP
jgi:hypothetical protein